MTSAATFFVTDFIIIIVYKKSKDSSHTNVYYETHFRLTSHFVFAQLLTTEWFRKKCTKFNALSFAIVCSRITRFHQNAQKLTDDTKDEQMLNIVIKYSMYSIWELLISVTFSRLST